MLIQVLIQNMPEQVSDVFFLCYHIFLMWSYICYSAWILNLVTLLQAAVCVVSSKFVMDADLQSCFRIILDSHCY